MFSEFDYLIEEIKNQDEETISLTVDKEVQVKKPKQITKINNDILTKLAPLNHTIKATPSILLDKIKPIQTAGSNWFHMPQPEITLEIKRDLHILASRGVLDPKRHYKKDTRSGLPKFFQFGTIVQGAQDFYSGRVVRKDQRDLIVQELLADNEKTRYFKNKFMENQVKKYSSAPEWFKKKMLQGKQKKKSTR